MNENFLQDSLFDYINRFYYLFSSGFYVCFGINGKLKPFIAGTGPVGICLFIDVI